MVVGVSSKDTPAKCGGRLVLSKDLEQSWQQNCKQVLTGTKTISFVLLNPCLPPSPPLRTIISHYGLSHANPGLLWISRSEWPNNALKWGQFVTVQYFIFRMYKLTLTISKEKMNDLIEKWRLILEGIAHKWRSKGLMSPGKVISLIRKSLWKSQRGGTCRCKGRRS